MAFQTIGIKLAVRDANKFVSDVGKAANAVYNYGQSVNKVQSYVIRLAKAQADLAQKELTRAQNVEARATEAKNREATAIAALMSRNQSLKQSIADLATEQGNMDKRTKAYNQSLITKTNLETLHANVLGKIAEASLKYKVAEDKVAKAADVVKEKQEANAKAQKAYNDTLEEGGGLLGTLFRSFQILLGSMDKQVAGNTALSRTLNVLSLKWNALNFILQTGRTALSAVGSVFSTIIGVGGTVIGIFAKLASTALNLGKAIVGGALSALKKLVAIPFNIAVSGLTAIWNSLKRIGEIAIGMNLSNLIWNFGTKLKEVGEMAVTAAGDFQLLRQRMIALLQREQLERFGTAFADSLGQATEKAAELTDWISQLAVKSIFSAESIANVFTLGMAYDLTAQDSQRLTDAIVNFSTGMGLQEDMMRRIIENLGQMQAAGKLTGTELRDLARGAFVPVNRLLEIFGDSLGMDTEKIGKLRTDLQKMVTEGEVDLKGFFEAFITMSNRDFPGAVDRMSTSWNVVISNIKDFIQSVIGWRVITPTLDLISVRLSKFISQFMQPDMLEFAKRLGNAFSYVASAILKIIDIATGIQNLNFGGIAKNFISLFDGAREFLGSLRGETNKSSIMGLSKIRSGIRGILETLGVIKRKNLTLSEALGFGVTDPLVEKFVGFVTKFITEIENIGKKPIGETVKNLLGIFGDTWETVWKEILQPILDKAWTMFWGWLLNIWNQKVVPHLPELWVGILDSVSDFFTRDFPAWWSGTGGPLLLTMINGLSTWATQSDLGKSIGESIISKIVTFMQSNAGPASSFAQQVGSVLASTFKIAIASALSFLTGGGEAITEPIAIGPQLPAGASIAAQRAEQDQLSGKTNESIPGLKKAIDDLAKTAQNALDGALKGLHQWAYDNIEPYRKITDLFTIFNTLMKPISESAEKFAAAMERLFKALGAGEKAGTGGNGVAGPIGVIMQFLSDLAAAEIEKIAKNIETIAKAIEIINKFFSGKGTEGVGAFGPATNPLGSMDDWDTSGAIGAFNEIKSESETTTEKVKTEWDILDGYLISNSLVPEMLIGIRDEFTAKLNEVINYLQSTFMPKVTETFGIVKWFSIGYNAISALFRGLKSMEGAILSWFDTFKSKFHINITFSVNAPTVSNSSSYADQQHPDNRGAKKGAHFIVPPGYNENFHLAVSSGEEVLVIPKSVVMRNMGQRFVPPVVSNFNRVNGNVSNVREVNNYLTVNSSQSSLGVINDFRNMRFLGDD